MIENDSKETVFHVAVAVRDLAEARDFYLNKMGCTESRDGATDQYGVFDFYGAQLVVIDAPAVANKPAFTTEPVEHFGIILHWDDWHALADKVKASGVEFSVAPNIIDHEGLGEVGNFFVCDPSGNALEFKSYRDRTKII